MRKKKHAEERFSACGNFFINEPETLIGRWGTVAEGRELRAEIGCGKGAFICGCAAREPDVLFIGIERESGAILLAAEKASAAGLRNVLFIRAYASHITQIFASGEISRLYLNFSDPWPKARHNKRRLTYKTFLELYREILPDGGTLEFKTDNRPFFDFSLEQFELCGMPVSQLTYDLHNSEYESSNIHTEYEDNFSAKGFAINRAVVTLHKKKG